MPSERIETAKEVKAQVAAAIASHRGRGYAPDTLRALIAREHRAGTRALTQLREQHRSEETARAKVAGSAIFGAADLIGTSDPALHATAYRAAQAQADTLDGQDQAARVLTKAERSGDELLARAVAAKAVERGWTNVATDYGQSRPEWRTALANIGDTRLSVGMGAAIVFGLRKPPELDGLREDDIARLVDRSTELYAAADAGPPPPLLIEDLIGASA